MRNTSPRTHRLSKCGKRTRWVHAATAAVCTAAVLVAATPAAADSGQQRKLAQQYTSLTASLIAAQADSSGKTLSSFLQDSQLSVLTPQRDVAVELDGGVAPISPLVVPAPSSLDLGLPVVSNRLNASSLGELSTQLAAYDVGFSKKDTASLTALTRAVLGKSATPDAQVTLGGAKWVADFASTTLAPPPSVGVPTAPSVPAGALPFGLLINQSLARMVGTSPEIFNQVTRNGVGSAKVQSAFDSAMSSVWAESQQDLQASVGDPCTGSMLAVMATGNPSQGRGCGTACTAGGMYLHGQTQSLFNPSLNSKVPSSIPGVLSNFQVNSLPSSVKAQMVQNQAISGSQLNQLLSSASTGCDVASAVTKGKLSSTFPKVWNGLK